MSILFFLVVFYPLLQDKNDYDALAPCWRVLEAGYQVVQHSGSSGMPILSLFSFALVT
jgi:hypothetical protein